MSGVNAQTMMDQNQRANAQAEQQARQAQLVQQSEQLKIQQAQRENDAQQAFEQTMGKYVSAGPSGIPSVDWGGLATDPAMQGHGSLVPGMVTNAYNNYSANMKYFGDRASTLARLAGSVNDDASKNSAVDEAVRQGLIDQDRGDQLRAAPYKDVQPQLNQWQLQGMSAEQQVNHAAALNTAAMTRMKEAPVTAENWMKLSATALQGAYDQDSLNHARGALSAWGAPQSTLDAIPNTWNSDAQRQIALMGVPKQDEPLFEQREMENASMKLQAAANVSKEAYAAALAKVPAGISSFFPQAEDWDQKKTPELVMKAGMLPNTLFTQENTAAWRNLTADQREARINQGWQRLNDQEAKAGAGGGQTPNSAAIDRRTAEREYQTLVLKEGKSNRERLRLGGLIAQGQEQNEKDGDIKQAYANATDDLAQTLSDKYEAAGRAGRGTPAVRLDDALTAIGRGSKPASPPPTSRRAPPARPASPAATPASQPNPTAAGKTFPRARLDAFAQANHLTPAQAEAALKAQNYTIQ